MPHGSNPGDSAPDFHLTSLEGKPYGLADFAGRPLTLVFVRHLA